MSLPSSLPLTPPVITVLYGNLLAGGIGRSRSETRLPALLRVVEDIAPHVLCLCECLYWDEQDHKLWNEVQARLGMVGVLGISPRTRMHTAVLVRPPLRVTEHRIDAGPLFRHSILHTTLAWPTGPQVPAGVMRVGCAHLHPRSPLHRLLEVGEALTEYADEDHLALVAMDSNTLDEDTDLSQAPTALLPRFAHPGTRTPDTRPMQLLEWASMVDLATVGGAVPLPTTGYWPGKRHKITGRPDRLLANGPLSAIADPVRVIDTPALRANTDHLWLATDLHPTRLTAHATPPPSAFSSAMTLPRLSAPS